MKGMILAATLLITFSGCALDTQETTDYDDVAYEAPAEEPPSHYGNSGGKHWPVCGGPGHVEYLVTPDGELVAFEMPVFCNPFYIYKGYPDPTLEEEGNPIDDNPIEHFMKESQHYE